MSSRAILRRVEELERVFTVGESGDDWVNVLMWSGRDGGAFGHVRFRFSRSRGEQHRNPCSDEEEVAIMRKHYEEEEAVRMVGALRLVLRSILSVSAISG